MDDALGLLEQAEALGLRDKGDALGLLEQGDALGLLDKGEALGLLEQDEALGLLDKDEALGLRGKSEEAPVSASLTEVPVAALVVAADGRILSRARNRPVTDHDPSAHAEVLALREAARVTRNYRLTDCVLVVTLEPCLMCVGALVHARVRGVVYGAADDRAGAVDSCIAGLNLPFLNHHPWHYGGVRGEVCAEGLRKFFSSRR